MAQKTLAQPAQSEPVIQWPELEFMRINELAKRWQCDASKIFDMVIAGNLWAHPREWMPIATYVKQEHCGEEKPDMHAVTVDWFIPATEVARFEEEHRTGARAGEMPDLSKPDYLDPRKETSYLLIIRALLKELDMPAEPYKATEVLMQAAALKGLRLPVKRDTIAQKIKAAYDLPD